ncbi:MAG: DUF1573 domain-containing protein [Bacteroidales bacterium]|nr:DUF1573 domain-containing protein [Bacteroidales bacterium]
MGLMAIFMIGAVKAQDTKEEPTSGAKIEFTKKEHDYGKIQKGADGNCVFEFKNTGTEPLILGAVRASCGCTTPTYTKEPIMPGQTGTINVRYNTNNVGGFNKTVTVPSNAVNDPRVVLRIKGTVLKPESTPTNNQ